MSQVLITDTLLNNLANTIAQKSDLQTPLTISQMQTDLEHLGWKHIANGYFWVSTTSTSAASVGTIACGSDAWTSNKILYVRIRDINGSNNGCFYGSDNFIINMNAANGSTSSVSSIIRYIWRKDSNGNWGSSTSTYGIYASSLDSSGNITITRRYNSTNSLTISSNYCADVYTIDFPGLAHPFAL